MMNWLERLADRLFPDPPKFKVVYTNELPPFLKDVVNEYLTAQKNGEHVSISVQMTTNEVVTNIACCPHCKQKNRLGAQGIVGAKCAACGLPLELLPKAKNRIVVQ